MPVVTPIAGLAPDAVTRFLVGGFTGGTAVLDGRPRRRPTSAAASPLRSTPSTHYSPCPATSRKLTKGPPAMGKHHAPRNRANRTSTRTEDRNVALAMVGADRLRHRHDRQLLRRVRQTRAAPYVLSPSPARNSWWTALRGQDLLDVTAGRRRRRRPRPGLRAQYRRRVRRRVPRPAEDLRRRRRRTQCGQRRRDRRAHIAAKAGLTAAVNDVAPDHRRATRRAPWSSTRSSSSRSVRRWAPPYSAA